MEVNSLGLPDELRNSLRSLLRYTRLSYTYYMLYTLCLVNSYTNYTSYS